MIDIQIDVLPREFAKPAQVEKMYRSQFRKHGEGAILKLRDKFSEVLRKGHSVDVGASGAASENINTRFRGGDEPVFEVYEGTATIANRKIREGLRAGHNVSYGVLRTWAANKGLKLYYDYKGGREPSAVLDKMTSKNGVAFERSRWFGRVGIKPQSRLRPSQVTKKAIYAMRTALRKEGTNRPTANWFTLRPGGRGYFNYPAFTRDTYKGEMKDIVIEMADNIIKSYNVDGAIFFGGK